MSTLGISPEKLGELLWPGIRRQIETSFKNELDKQIQEIVTRALDQTMQIVRMQLNSMHQIDAENVLLQLSVDFGGGNVEKKQF